MSSNNKIIEEIKKRSGNYYKSNLEFFEFNKESDVKHFINLIFSDIVNIEQIPANELFDVIKDPRIAENFFNKYNEKIMYFKNGANIYTEEIKLRIKEKVKQLLKKIIECNSHIELIKKSYVDLVISNRLSSKNINELSLKNKSVLFLDDKKERYKIAEILTRYMITILTSQQSNNKKASNSDINIYYNDSELFNFIDLSGPTINDKYNDWVPQTKYFIVQLMLIDILFDQNSDFKKLFNSDTLKKYIDEFIKPDKKDEKSKNKEKKKNKNSKKRFSGGSASTGSTAEKLMREFAKENKKNKKNKQKETKFSLPSFKTNNKKENKKENSKSASLKKGYIEVMKNTEIKNLTMNTTMNTIFYSKFKYLITSYFIKSIRNKYCSIGNNKKIQISANEDNPFYKSERLFYNNYFSSIPKNSSGRQNITEYDCNRIDSIFNDFKFNIFNSFIVFKNSDNYAILLTFIKKVKEYIIFILFSLYNTKKKIYEAYINSAKTIFLFDVNELSKEVAQEKKPNDNKKNNEKEKKRVKPIPVNVNSKSIESVKKKLDILDKQYENINDDKKKLLLQKLQHKMIVEKLNKKQKTK